MTSRQYEWSVKNHAKGLCRACTAKAYKGGLCDVPPGGLGHYIKWLCYMKDRRKKRKLLRAEFKEAIKPNG